MKHSDLNSMTVDELWSLHEQIVPELARKLAAEKARLEQRLRQLSGPGGTATNTTSAQVLPKYRNPEQPSETWSGRGKTPRWLNAQLRSGKKLKDFRS